MTGPTLSDLRVAYEVALSRFRAAESVAEAARVDRDLADAVYHAADREADAAGGRANDARDALALALAIAAAAVRQ